MKVAAVLLAGLMLAVSAAQAGPRATAPVLGFDWTRETHRTLAWFDPATLDRLPGRQAPLGDHTGSWAFSPDRTLLAASSSDRGTIRIVDARSMRVVRDLRVGSTASNIGSLAWVGAQRLLAVSAEGSEGEGAMLYVLDVRRGRVLRRVRLEQNVWGFARVSGGAAYLQLAIGSFAPVRVAVTDAGGNVRSVVLDRITGGSIISDEGSNDPTANHRVPGFAVDPAGARAFVVGVDLTVAEIDLATLAVRYHTLGGSRTLAKSLNGPSRYAVWLGGDTLAVGGEEWSTTGTGSDRKVTATPLGVRLVDTAAWTDRLVDPDAAFFQTAADGLLASHGILITGPRTYVAYGRDGGERYRLTLPRDTWTYASGDYVYVCGGNNTGTLRSVLDAASGRTLRTLGSNSAHRCPELLRQAGSSW